MMRIYDDDDDDEDLILYKEKQGPIHQFSLSQTTTTTNNNNNDSQISQEAPSPIKATRTRGIISRQERRKRRHEWRERQLLEQEQQQQELAEEVPTPESEDAFASLQSLLLEPSQDSSQPTSRLPQGSEKENVCRDEDMKDDAQRNAMDESDSNVPAVEAVRKQEDPGSGHDSEATDSVGFDTFRDDYDDDQDQIGTLPEPSNLLSPRGFDSHNDSTFSPVRRPKKPRQSLDKLRHFVQRGTISSQNRMPRIPQHTPSMESDSLRLSNPWNRKTQHQLHRMDTNNNVKSLVGSRPTHWNRTRDRSMTSLQSQRRRKLTQSRSLSPSHLSTSRTIDTATLLKSKYLPRRSSNSRNGGTRSQSPSKQRSKSPSLSFAPSFMPKTKRRNATTDQLEETHDTTELLPSAATVTTVSALPPILSSPPPMGRRRRGRKTSGPLGRKLEALQSARANDALRLHNPAFIRHGTMLLDRNDPRKRATSQTDITIVGGGCAGVRRYGGGGGGVAEDSQQFTLLVYVHSHRRTGQPATIEHELAWATFTFATARKINLQKGKQFRLYNAIFISCQRPTTIQDLVSLGKLKSDVCQYTIVATWLCEEHPGGLLDLSITTNTEMPNNEMDVDA